MAQFWKASSVTVNNGSKIVTVNTGDDVANIITNSMLQISNFQYVEVKTVNTVNQTIELFFDWDKGNVSAQPAIAAPNRAAIKEAVEELRALRQTYEALASDVSVAPSANSVPRRDNNGRIKASAGVDPNDVVVQSQLGTAAAMDVTTSRLDTDQNHIMKVRDFGLGDKVATEYPSNDLDDVTVPCGFYRLINNMPSSGTRPEGFSSFAYCQVQTYDIRSKLQTVVDVTGKKAHRTFSESDAGQWVYDYNSGNSVNPLDYGIGGNAPQFEDWNEIPLTFGGFCAVTATASNLPTGLPSGTFYTLLYLGRANDQILAFNNGGGSVHRLRRSNQTTWIYEGEVFHSGNTNFNEFNIPQGKSRLGVARYAGEVHVEFPLQSYTAPTGLSVTGTFKVIDLTNGTAIATGITPTIVGADCTNKNGIIKLVAVGQYVAGRNYRVEAENNVTLSFNF